MKKSTPFIILVFLLTPVVLFAQGRIEISFSYFKQVSDPDLLPKNAVVINGYAGTLEDANYVSENPKTAASIIKIIKGLRANGTEDINKCFIPRHVATFSRGDSVLYHVLICFECDGIRFSNEKKTTRIKSVDKREKLMAQLKEWFTVYHFDSEGKN